MRLDPIAVPLADGTVLLAGGGDASGPVASAEIFDPGSATFAARPRRSMCRARAPEALLVPNVGALVTGGLDATGSPIATRRDLRRRAAQFLTLPD